MNAEIIARLDASFHKGAQRGDMGKTLNDILEKQVQLHKTMQHLKKVVEASVRKEKK